MAIDAAYILAGGESKRFGGDKLIALVDGAPSIARLAASLRMAGARLVFVSTVEDWRCQLYSGLSSVDGCIIDNTSIPCGGPGRALASIFHHADRSGFRSIIVAAGDMPWLNWKTIYRLNSYTPRPGWASAPLHGNGFIESLLQAHHAPYPRGFEILCKYRGKLRATDALRLASNGVVLVGSGLLTSWSFEYAHINTRLNLLHRKPKSPPGYRIVTVKPFIQNAIGNRESLCASLRTEEDQYAALMLNHLFRHARSDRKQLCFS